MDTIFSEPLPQSHKDLRSPSQDRHHHLNLYHKYYSYRSVHPSMVGQPIYYAPNVPTDVFPPITNDLLLTHASQLRIRHWTKRDQFLACETDIWRLDRRTHKVGRRKRRGCDYVPPRWKEERGSKGRSKTMQLAGEEDYEPEVAMAIAFAREMGDLPAVSEAPMEEWSLEERSADSVTGTVDEEADLESAKPMSVVDDTADGFDMLDDLYSEDGTTDCDWEIIDV